MCLHFCRRYNITQEFASVSSPQFNGVAERALWLIEAATLAAAIQAPILFPNVEFFRSFMDGGHVVGVTYL